MMRFLLTIILAASVAFAAIGSRGSDLVLCVGPGGHVAVEHEHASGDCRKSGEDHDDHHNDFQDHADAVTLGQAPANPACTDLDPCGIDAGASSRSGDEAVVAPTQLVPPGIASLAMVSQDFLRHVCPDDSPPTGRPPDVVRHVVLLN